MALKPTCWINGFVSFSSSREIRIRKEGLDIEAPNILEGV